MVTMLRKTHVSRVNARHLLDDLASSYTYPVKEAVLVELIANSLDAGAANINFRLNPREASLTIEDDGRGMLPEEFERYHDLAESRKTRGKGIGFAGLGAKLGHEVANRIATVTKSGSIRTASDWRWKGDDLEWNPTRSRISHDGTMVTLHLAKSYQDMLQREFVEKAVRRHFGALLDPYLSELYIWESIYPKGVNFLIDGARLSQEAVLPPDSFERLRQIEILGRRKKRIGRAVFGISREPLPEEAQGIVIATYGKSIRRDTLGVHPREPALVAGWIEVPGLVECLTLNKQDFVGSGTAGTKCRRLRVELQKAYLSWLQEIGESREPAERRRASRRLEQETAGIIRRIPELQYLLAARLRSDLPVAHPEGDAASLIDSPMRLSSGDGDGSDGGTPTERGLPTGQGRDEGDAMTFEDAGTSYARTRRIAARGGPHIERVPDESRPEMSWLEGETVVINSAHPTYLMSDRRQLMPYHERFAIFQALCAEAPVDADEKLSVLGRALTEWGKS